MATRIQSRIHILENYLLESASLLNFFQALHMLFRLARFFHADPGRSIRIKPILNFHQAHGTPIKSIRKLEKAGHYEMETSYFSLYTNPGHMGYEFSEYLLEELREDRYTLYHLLHLLQNNLYQTYYQTAYQHHLLYPLTEQNSAAIRTAVLDLLGYGSHCLKDRHYDHRDQAIILTHVHLFAQRHRSARGLQCLLNAYFASRNIQIYIREDVSYLNVPKDALRIQLTENINDQSKILGENSILGQYENSILASIEIQMKFNRYNAFLTLVNSEKNFNSFLQTVKLYMEQNMYLRMKAMLPAPRKESRLTRLGYKTAAILGKNAWLYTRQRRIKDIKEQKHLVAHFAIAV